MPKSLSEFWDGEHSRFNLDRTDYHNISGYGLGAYEQALQVAPLLPKVVNVLEIGVGTGAAIRDYVRLGKYPVALDISSVAVERAMQLGALGGFTSPSELPQSIFDLATCHLVAQHVPDPEFANLLFHVCRSLAPGGILAVQSSYVPGVIEKHFNFAAQGNILRTEERMREMMIEAGFAGVTLVSNFEILPEERVWWQGFHGVKQ